MEKDINIEEKGFSPGNWTSRDFEMRIPCRNRDCFLNQWGKECASPSVVYIDKSGSCEMYQKELEDRKKKK